MILAGSLWLSSLLLRTLLAVADIQSLLSGLPAAPEQVSILNDFHINSRGGHLQGVQLYKYNNRQFLYLSGSSYVASYLTVASIDSQQQMIRHIELLKKPMKHAGGFQIHRNWLAIGIEDNEARNTSLVRVYQLGDPEQGLGKLRAEIERYGLYERATAGCVAIQEMDQRLLLVVGDWNSRHLDFYQADITTDSILRFKNTFELDMEAYSRDEWLNSEWYSYQNINLITLDNQLYLFAFAGSPQGEDVIDVFSLEPGNGQNWNLTKIASTAFKGNKDTRFRWGSGLFYEPGSPFTILSCSEHIRQQTTVSIYRGR